MLVYKIVRRLDCGHRISALAQGKVVRYCQNRVAKRPKGCGPLTAFKNLNAARESEAMIERAGSRLPGKQELWLAEATPSHATGIWCLRKYNNKRHPAKLIWLPRGTILCNTIRLLEKVKNA